MVHRTARRHRPTDSMTEPPSPPSAHPTPSESPRGGSASGGRRSTRRAASRPAGPPNPPATGAPVVPNASPAAAAPAPSAREVPDPGPIGDAATSRRSLRRRSRRGGADRTGAGTAVDERAAGAAQPSPPGPPDPDRAATDRTGTRSGGAARPSADRSGGGPDTPTRRGARSESAGERLLRSLVSTRPTQLSPTAAMRAREVAAPTAADLAEAEAELTIVRRNYVPPAPLTTVRRPVKGRRGDDGGRTDGPDAVGARDQEGRNGGSGSNS